MTIGSHNHNPLCEAAIGFMNSWVPGDQPPGGAPEILKHIEECPDCSRELALRTRIADGLKTAVQSQVEGPYLAARIRRSLKQQSQARGWRGQVWRLSATAAALVFCLGISISYHFGHLRLTRSSQGAYISSIFTKVPGILRVGLGDHVHCTVFRKFPEQPPSAAAMVAQLGPVYGGLLPLVRAGLPEDYKVLMAHRCSYRGRRFIHLALRNGSVLMSLVISRRASGESFEGDGLVRALSESGVPVYQGGVQRFAIAAFETGDHLAYLISNLPEQQNLRMAASLAKPVQKFLARLTS